MRPILVSLDEIQENEADQERDTEDEQSFVSAALASCPDEEVSCGFYNGKPRDLVSLFRDSDDCNRGEEDE